MEDIGVHMLTLERFYLLGLLLGLILAAITKLYDIIMCKFAPNYKSMR